MQNLVANHLRQPCQRTENCYKSILPMILVLNLHGHLIMASSKFGDDSISVNCNVSLSSHIYIKFWAIMILDSWSITLDFSLITTFNLIKAETKQKKSLT